MLLHLKKVMQQILLLFIRVFIIDLFLKLMYPFISFWLDKEYFCLLRLVIYFSKK